MGISTQSHVRLARMLDTTCELFANPLNSSMKLNVDYCATFQDDAIFGAIFEPFSYR